MDAAGARHVGARLLGEVEEGSLEELLGSLRNSFVNTTSLHRSPHIPFPELSAIIARYQRATQSAPPPHFSVSGRYLPLLYHLISTLIAAPHKYAVAIIDTEGLFDVTRLINPAPAHGSSYPATLSDLKHVYVYLPGRGQEQVKAAVTAVEEFMLYEPHGSRDREWWGTVVIGGTGGDVNAGWKGWLRVEREDVSGFAMGMSVEEALRERRSRQEAVDSAGWAASARWGRYLWKGG
ncbi:hypothetical protein F5Y19DRAFT_482070 [Xylariaceae sp. FL1651]|nr:hypothetical protein F5Y19DRAFT_482070 [Xylariaceae sp. FL1651]